MSLNSGPEISQSWEKYLLVLSMSNTEQTFQQLLSEWQNK